jgi:hypothetical protein
MISMVNIMRIQRGLVIESLLDLFSNLHYPNTKMTVDQSKITNL